jgi:peptidylprolyl isomerase
VPIVRRLVAGVCVPLLLATAACSGSGDSSPTRVVTLAAIHVSGPSNDAPKVRFTAPVAFAKTAGEIVAHGPGTGPAVSMSSLVTVKYVAINASDQNVFGSSWRGKDAGAATFYVNSVVRGFAKGLVGAHAGDRVLIGSQAKDAFDGTGNLAASVRPGDSVIFVVDVEKVFPEQSLPDTVPTLKYDGNGNPAKFTAGPDVTKKPTKLGVYPIIEGPGPKLKSGDSVSVEYFGQIYPDGNVFNAWTGNAFTAQLGAGQVIKGWDQGLVGQRVGSRVVLVVPPDLGYGKKEQSGIPKNSTLVFTVQILSIS